MTAAAYYADTFDHAVRVGTLSLGGVLIAIIIALTVRAIIRRRPSGKRGIWRQHSGVTLVAVPKNPINWDDPSDFRVTSLVPDDWFRLSGFIDQEQYPEFFQSPHSHESDVG